MANTSIQSFAVAIVLVSDVFLRSHPYLMESAALVKAPDMVQSKSEAQEREGLYDLCQIGAYTEFDVH